MSLEISKTTFLAVNREKLTREADTLVIIGSLQDQSALRSNDSIKLIHLTHSGTSERDY